MNDVLRAIMERRSIRKYSDRPVEREDIETVLQAGLHAPTGGDAEPKRWIRVFFTLATAVLAVALLLAGGLSALQTAAITIALPFSVVMLLICWATVIAFRRERRVYERAERAQLVDYVGEHYGLDVETGNEQGVRMPRWWRARRHPPA